jgi:hypothetical protein
MEVVSMSKKEVNTWMLEEGPVDLFNLEEDVWGMIYSNEKRQEAIQELEDAKSLGLVLTPKEEKLLERFHKV